jgi:AcrR family transcriptional regulator
MAVQQPRLPLNRDRILRAALELADAGGIASLTMRRLGQALGFEAMSLYNYVANKDDVLDGILDLVLEESEPPPSAGDWDAAIRSSAISVHAAFLRHPWACNLLMAPAHIRPARLRYMDSLLGRLREAGFSAETTYHAYHVLDAHIFGFSLWQASHSSTAAQASNLAADFERIIPIAEFPYLHEHGEQHLAGGPHDDVSAFEFALDFILDGLAKIRGMPAAEESPEESSG